LDTLAALLEAQSQRAEGIENCWTRARHLAARLSEWDSAEEDVALIRWVEVFQHSVQLHTTPLSVAEAFSRQRAGQPRAWIFTSATLAVKNDFSHFAGQLGLDDARTYCWTSPFDYERQAL